MLVQWGCSSQTSPFFLTIFPQYTYVFILLLVKELDWFAFHIWRGFPLLINCQLLENVRLKQKILRLWRQTSPLPWMWTRLRDMYHSDLSRHAISTPILILDFWKFQESSCEFPVLGFLNQEFCLEKQNFSREQVYSWKRNIEAQLPVFMLDTLNGTGQ